MSLGKQMKRSGKTNENCDGRGGKLLQSNFLDTFFCNDASNLLTSVVEGKYTTRHTEQIFGCGELRGSQET